MSLSLHHAEGMRPRVLIAGGGAAGLEALIALRDLAEDRVDIELLTARNDFVYRPLTVAEPFGLGQPRRYDLNRIVADHDGLLNIGTLQSVEPDARRVLTADGAGIDYDALLVAVGAEPAPALPGAITPGVTDYVERFTTMLRELAQGRVRRLVFAVPPHVAWHLPLYELALVTAAWAATLQLEVEISLVTPDAQPLELFGIEASQALHALLAARDIRLRTNTYPESFEGGHLKVVPSDIDPIPADRVISLPRALGPRVGGLPEDPDGFIPVDLHGRVEGRLDVYAAGDVIAFPIKQGGLATQQADAAAEMIAARAGAILTPTPFRPVLRGLLLTGGIPRYLEADIAGGGGSDHVSEHALWWPPSKIAGRYLSPYLGVHHRQVVLDQGSSDVPIEIDLEHRRFPAAPQGSGHAPSGPGGAPTRSS